MFNPCKIQDNLYWVGAIDWDIRFFHGYTYTTRTGTTYNSYLLKDDKTALIDGVHCNFFEEWIERTSEAVDLKKIDYFICNHIEPDHSGAIPKLMKLLPGIKIITNQKAKEGLEKYYPNNWDFQIVKTGDTLKLGKNTLRFIEAPMIHWPDSMFTYLDKEEILFSNDAFGQHYASQERFDDEVDFGMIMDENAKYYANILWPLSATILRKLQEIQKLNLPIKMILTSHGLNWRKYPDKAIESYLRWAKGESKEKVIIAYDTMWFSTEKMASAILEGITAEGVRAEVYRVPISDLSDIMKDLLDARGLLVGSSVANNHILPTITKLLAELKSLKPINKIGAFFGSYGWSKDTPAKELEAQMNEAGIKLVLPPINVKYAPSPEELKQCFNFGKTFATKLKTPCTSGVQEGGSERS